MRCDAVELSRYPRCCLTRHSTGKRLALSNQHANRPTAYRRADLGLTDGVRGDGATAGAAANDAAGSDDTGTEDNAAHGTSDRDAAPNDNDGTV